MPPEVQCLMSNGCTFSQDRRSVDMDRPTSMDIHEKYVDMDMDMDVIFHIHGNPGNTRQPNSTTYTPSKPEHCSVL